MPSFLRTQSRATTAFLTRLFNSRFFIISLFLHLLLVVTIGGTVLFQRYVEPPDFSAAAGEGFVTPDNAPQAPQQQQQQPLQQQPTFTVTAPTTAATAPSMSAITTTAPTQTAFTIPAIVTPTIGPNLNALTQPVNAPAAPVMSGNMPMDVAKGIAGFTGGWQKGGGGAGGSGGSSMKSREFQFTAYLAKYSSGDWNATVQLSRDKKIVGGSLPNLLYVIGKLSRDKIIAEPQAVPLDLSSDEIFAKKPPFIFFCGHRDFTLTETEVQNLRKYVQLGGCIWGDSSLPGLRSRFDIAFRREMRRVVPDVDKNFEPLPMSHDIFSRNPAKVYFTDIVGVPPGMNYYQEPVYALKIYGEIAVLYTANDYGDMWQFGINERGEIDTRRDENYRYVALDEAMYAKRDLYFRNISAPALFATYKFGTNIIVHLLTRWESKVRNVVPGGL